MKSIESLKKELLAEGYRDVYEWKDAPDEEYATHSHDTDTALLILEGEVFITRNGNTRKFVAGERADIKAYEVHSARVGAGGCTYLVGEGKEAAI